MNSKTKISLQSAIDEYYGHTLGLNGASELGWESDSAQHKRFKILTDCKDLQGKKLLDLGAGLGDLVRFLDHEGIVVDYYATEIFGPFYNRLQQSFPGKIFNENIFQNKHFFKKDEFDVIYVAGAFNLSSYSNLKFLLDGLKTLTHIARESVVVSLLDIASPSPEDQYAYFDPDELIKLLHIPHWKAQVVRAYLPNDFTLCMDKIRND